MNRPEYDALAETLERLRRARGYVRENRGFDREQAKEGVEACVADEVVPALEEAVVCFVGDVDARKVERLGRLLLKLVEDPKP